MNDAKQNSDNESTILEAISRLWWMPLLRGIMLIVLGIYALVSPGMTVAVFVQVFGFFLIAEGFISILAAIMGKTPSRLWTGARGVLAVLVGLLIFGNAALVAGVSATMLLYIIAGFMVAAGILEIIAVIKDHRRGMGWMLVGAIAMIAFGVLIFAAPLLSAKFIVRVVGAGAVINGGSLIALAFRLKGLKNV